MGMRGVFHNTALPAERAGTGDQRSSEYNYFLWRLEHGVAEGPVEIPSGEALPLEYNLAGLGAVCFRKGCYIGQELTARSHFRGVVRKRVMPATFQDTSTSPPPPCPTTAVVAGNSVLTYGDEKKKMGRLSAVTKDLTRGLALLRLQQALNPASELRVEDSEVAVRPLRPQWWPSQWGTEEQ
uniref:CAF17 C-terminal domain-containing protein n=1 Tax=Pyramimonas obovata TaxID=1411642 RepID=A0A7S0RDL5_9CHLO